MENLYNILYYLIYAVYAILFKFYNKIIGNKKTFSLPIDNYREAVKATDDEWNYEKLMKNKSLFFEGSNGDGTVLQFDISCKEKHQFVKIHLNYKNEIFFGEFSGKYVNETTISFGPLIIELRNPFRRWRLNFKGNLKNIISEKEKFVCFSGWWKPTSDARFFYSNSTLCNFMTFLMKNPRNVIENLKTIAKIQRFPAFHQDGQFHTEMIIDNATQIICLRGLRTCLPDNFQSATDQFYVYLEDGNRLNYCTSVIEQNVKISHGFITRGDRIVRKIKLVDSESLAIDNHRLIEFKVSGFPNFCVRKDSLLSEFQYLNGNNEIVTIKRMKVVSGLTHGIAMFKSVRESLIHHPPAEFIHFEEICASEDDKSRKVLPFHHRACQDKSLTGGKGSNLAILRTIENKFHVPQGVVITTTAFNDHLQHHENIAELVSSLSAPRKTLEEQIEIGKKVQEAFKASSISSLLTEDIKNSGLELDANKRYAVRSSAVGEDGADLSSAGQLESCLNVPIDQINSAIIECWCSNFRTEVITYRRNYGQLVNPPMAVVIQEMRVGGRAGVMFTCDPVMNDDSSVIINVIDGIGEDIVSGKVTPDELKIIKSTLEITKPENCCLTVEQVAHLVKVGIFLEKTFGKAQDVEFVVKSSEVYIVQSRDVTGRDAETEFELLTELDSALLSEHEVITTANVGEVIPFASKPLELTMGLEFDKMMTKLSLEQFRPTMGRHPYTAGVVSGGTQLLNIGELFMRSWKTYESDRLAEICVAGTKIFSEKDFKFAKQRYPEPPAHFMVMTLVKMIYSVFVKSKTQLKRVHEEDEKGSKLVPTKDSSEYTFEELMKLWREQSATESLVLEYHSNITTYSSFTYMIVGMLVRGAGKELTAEMLSDFAEIFSNCSNVISADIPLSFKKIAAAVIDDGLNEEFLELGSHEGIFLLKTRGIKSKVELNNFVELHGHRGVGELYLSGKSWADDLHSIVPSLKTIIRTNDVNCESKVGKPIDELVDGLSCKPTGFRKTLMKFMVKRTHQGVINREAAKTCLVRGVYNMRKTPRLLAKKMTEEGYLPDEDLLYYFQFDEIEEFQRTRSAKYIARAQRRRKVFPLLQERKYDHVSRGLPKAIVEGDKRHFETLESLNGTVVCRGRVIGKARVARTLAEAEETQPGEILITHCTDVCWSPFFPIIKGIVTEIGGLLSHGAVVAREYGLPCLIAVDNAVSVFETGEYVELNTDAGTISKVKQLASQNI